MLVKMMEVLVKIAVMMMAPGSAPVPPEARGREDTFFFFLELLPRWEKVMEMLVNMMEVLVNMMEVLVKIAVMMMAPDGVPAPPEARGRQSPPSSSSSLTFSLDGRRVYPLVHGLHGM